MLTKIFAGIVAILFHVVVGSVLAFGIRVELGNLLTVDFSGFYQPAVELYKKVNSK